MLRIAQKILRSSMEAERVRKKEGEKILKFHALMNMLVRKECNLKKRKRHHFASELAPSKTQVDYFFVWRNQIKFVKHFFCFFCLFVKHVKLLFCLTYKPLLYDFKVRKDMETTRS